MNPTCTSELEDVLYLQTVGGIVATSFIEAYRAG